MKLWNEHSTLDSRIEAFTIGRDPELDLLLAPWDVLGTLAHVRMLGQVGLLSPEEVERLEPELRALYAAACKGDLRLEAGVEDIHSQVELELVRRLGEVGKKVHSGRSRNDQVLLDLRLFLRAGLERIVQKTEGLARTLLELSERHRDMLMPGYTHTQIAMPSSFGLWFGAFAESLVDDLRLSAAAYAIVNQNPLGSAAGYGSSFPLDRSLTTRLLGFRELSYNALHAQLGRGKTEWFVATALAAVAATLNKLCSDLCLFSSGNFDFFRLPEAFTTGSSIMPHKRNPDVFELIRGRCNLLLALPQQIALLDTNLISGYHRDYQLLKEPLFPALRHLEDGLELLTHALPQLEPNPHILEDPRYRLLFTVEAVNARVQQGTPFRDAYHAVAREVKEGTFHFEGTTRHTHEGSIGNLCNDAIEGKLERVLTEFPFAQVRAALDVLSAGSGAAV